MTMILDKQAGGNEQKCLKRVFNLAFIWKCHKKKREVLFILKSCLICINHTHSQEGKEREKFYVIFTALLFTYGRKGL